MNISYIIELCRDVAYNIPVERPAGDDYAERVAALLFFTGAHESNYVHTRQARFNFTTYKGAFGYWQIEPINFRESMRQLNRRPDLAANVAGWYYGSKQSPPLPYKWQEEASEQFLVWELSANPRLACLFARLAYYWDPNKVPEMGPENFANYWRKAYNKNWKNDYRDHFKRHYEKFLPLWENHAS